MSPGRRSCARRGVAAQRPERAAERLVRRRVLAFTRWVRGHGLTLGYAAEMLELKPNTLQGWERRWAEDRLGPEPLGRPLHCLAPEVHELVCTLYALIGPPLSLEVLRSFFPTESVAALEELRRRLKREYKYCRRVCLQTLRWRRTGAVWAMDFFHPPLRVDGIYKYVLVVRDLTSGNFLLALPTLDREAATVVQALRFLFAAYGAPLVLKSDNEFDADAIRRELEAQGVIPLLSPPEFPRYNGAVEAGIGTLKTRVFYEAAHHDRPLRWTSDDLEAGIGQANELVRADGYTAATPGERWNRRLPIAQEERAAFQAAVQKRMPGARERLGILPGLELTRQEHNSVMRLALAQALVDQGLLQVRRRRITPPFPLRFW